MSILSAVLTAALAQSPAVPSQMTPSPSSQPPAQSTPVPIQQPATAPPQAAQPQSRPGVTPPPSGQQPARPAPMHPRSEAMNNLQGFNIVLLVGESQSSGPSIEDLPPAAKKALADMRDFLPFKNYRVLDSQWTSCCANPGGTWISGRLQGVTAAQSGSQIQLVPRAYSFKLMAQASGAESRLNVSFTLTPDQMGSRAEQSPISTAREAELEKRLSELRRELDTIEDEIPRRTTPATANNADVAALQARRRRVQQQIVETTQEVAASRSRGPEVDRSNRNLVDGSFVMEVGETVVVGTSRLGGDKALIAIVTAARKTAAR